MKSQKPQPAISPDTTLSWRNDRVFWAIFCVAALLGLIYNATIMLGFGPDEPRHMAYVKLLLNEHRFPFQFPGGLEYGGAHSYHPPLYYLVLVPFLALFRALPGESEWHLLRLVSLVLCLATLPLIYQIAERAGGNGSRNEAFSQAANSGGALNSNSVDHRWFARLIVAQVALLPIFGMTSGIINNDSALLFSVTLFLWLLVVKYPREQSWRSALILGLVLGLGALCKATALVCDGAALLAWLALQNRSGRGRGLGRFVLVLVVGIAIAAPWYARNIALYGTYQPIPSGFTNGALPAPSYGMLIMLMHPNFPPLFAQANWGIFYTLWAQRDWLLQTQSPSASAQPPLQPVQHAIYLVLLAYSALAAIGHLRRAPKSKQTDPSTKSEAKPDSIGSDASPKETDEAATKASTRNEVAASEAVNEARAARLARWVPGGAFVAAWLACLQVALFVHWGQAEGGRYLLPALCGLSLFLARGWRALLGKKALRPLFFAWCAFCLALNAISVYWMLFYLNPMFGPKA